MNRIAPTPHPFLEASGEAPLPGAPALLGVGYDGTASFRAGAKWAPDAIRAVSEMAIEGYSPTQDRDLYEYLFADLGNLEIPPGPPEEIVKLLHDATREILAADAIPLILGGEHSISPGAIRATFEKFPDLAVIQFDAHADLREEWDGTSHSHACTMRRVLDFLPSERLLQVGIRSGIREEFTEMKQAGRLVSATAEALSRAIETKGFSDRPLYITFDLDLFDPSLIPGTGTPEAGGIDWPTFETLRSTVPAGNIVAMDIVELSPRLDPSDLSTVVATKVLREWLLAMGKPPPSTA